MTCIRTFPCDHALRSASAIGAEAKRRPFALPGVTPRFSRDREVDLRHVVLELDVDFERGRLAGRATQKLRALRPDVTRITLDAVELEVSRVTLDGDDAAFRDDGRKLTVTAPRALSERRDTVLVVEYECAPRRGFYFIRPEADSPDRTVHAWSQGQDEDSRHWWPVHDYPNEKATTEVIATVPADFVAISNGRLVSSRKKAGRRTWHWKQEVPHVPYLVTLAVGPFDKLEQRAGKVPLTTWYLDGRRDEALRCVEDTPRMVKLFGDLLGVPYPFAKYDQIFVQAFIFGGMENTSATTLTDLVLHDERAALDYSAEDLVSHELAHQWWGNLVTCRDWSQAWLNEGFATYFELVWKEHAHGSDEEWVLRVELKDSYLKEDRGSYRRAIVCRSYEEPIELFDAHLYQKGAWVVSMLRHELGDVLFWRSLGIYLTTHREGHVETADLRRAVEKASGRNFERFFEQWVEKAGYPSLKITSSWDAERRELSVEVEQQQEGADTPEAFELVVEFAFLVDGEWREERSQLKQRRQTFLFALESEPDAVVFDPRERILADVSFDRPPRALVEALENAPWVPARACAAEALGKAGSPRAIAALAKALREDAFWGVQAAAAAALGESRTTSAEDALLEATDVAHPKARRAVMAALGAFRTPRAARALRRVVVEGDESYFVEAEAAISLGKTRQAGARALLTRALASKKRSWNDILRCGAIHGLGHLGHEERDTAIPILLAWTEPRRFVRCRVAAIDALARVGEGKEGVRERLETLLEDAEFRVVLAAAEGLAKLGSRKSRAALARVAEMSLDGRIKRTARESMLALGEDEPPALAPLRSDLEALSAEGRKLKEKVQQLELRLESLEPR